MSFVLQIVLQWLRDTQFHKMAASTAAGTSLGFLTMMSVFDAKLEKANADFDKRSTVIESKVMDVEHFIKARKELTDERFMHIDAELKYMRGAIDATNQNVLRLINNERTRR